MVDIQNKRGSVARLQRGGVKYGVNGTLEWAGSSKNYYIHPLLPPHHLSFPTDRGPRRYDRTRLIFSTLLCQVNTQREAVLLWQKEKEVNNTPTPVYWINRAARMISSSQRRWVLLFKKWWYSDTFLSKSPQQLTQDEEKGGFDGRVSWTFEWMEPTGKLSRTLRSIGACCSLWYFYTKVDWNMSHWWLGELWHEWGYW